MSSKSFKYSSSYERMSGNCTRILASQMVSQLSVPMDSSSYILDNACGPGIVSEQVKLKYPEAKIMATDLSPGMIESVREKIIENEWSNMDTDILDVRSLSTLRDQSFTHVFTNLGLPVPNDPESGLKATQEIYRVLKVGGVAILTTWADRVWPVAFKNTALAIRPQDQFNNPMALPSELMRGSWLAAQLEQGGFGTNVEVRQSITYTEAGSLDDLADNMLLAAGMFFPGYTDKELERAKVVFRDELKKLRTFEEHDGVVRVGMKAWIGVGWKRGDEGEVCY